MWPFSTVPTCSHTQGRLTSDLDANEPALHSQKVGEARALLTVDEMGMPVAVREFHAGVGVTSVWRNGCESAMPEKRSPQP